MAETNKIYLNDIELDTFFKYFNETNILNKNLEPDLQPVKVPFTLYKMTLQLEDGNDEVYYGYTIYPIILPDSVVLSENNKHIFAINDENKSISNIEISNEDETINQNLYELPEIIDVNSAIKYYSPRYSGSPYSFLNTSTDIFYLWSNWDNTNKQIIYNTIQNDGSFNTKTLSYTSLEQVTSGYLSSPKGKVFLVKRNGIQLGYLFENTLIMSNIEAEEHQIKARYKNQCGDIVYDVPDSSKFEEYVQSVRTSIYGEESLAHILHGDTTLTYYEDIFINYLNKNYISMLSKVKFVDEYTTSDLSEEIISLLAKSEIYSDNKNENEMTFVHHLVELDKLHKENLIQWQVVPENITNDGISDNRPNVLYSFETETKKIDSNLDINYIQVFDPIVKIPGIENTFLVYCGLNNNSDKDISDRKYLKISDNNYVQIDKRYIAENSENYLTNNLYKLKLEDVSLWGGEYTLFGTKYKIIRNSDNTVYQLSKDGILLNIERYTQNIFYLPIEISYIYASPNEVNSTDLLKGNDLLNQIIITPNKKAVSLDTPSLESSYKISFTDGYEYLESLLFDKLADNSYEYKINESKYYDYILNKIVTKTSKVILEAEMPMTEIEIDQSTTKYKIGTITPTNFSKTGTNITKYTISEILNKQYANKNFIDKINIKSNRGDLVTDDTKLEEDFNYFFSAVEELLNSKESNYINLVSYDPDFIKKEHLWIQSLYNLFSDELRITNGAFIEIDEQHGTNLKYNKKSVPDQLILSKRNSTTSIPAPNYKEFDFNDENYELTEYEIEEINEQLSKESAYMRLLRYQDFPTIQDYRNHLIKNKKYNKYMTSHTIQEIAKNPYQHKDLNLKKQIVTNMTFKKPIESLLLNYFYNDQYVLFNDEPVSYYLKSFDDFYAMKIKEPTPEHLVNNQITIEKRSFIEFPIDKEWEAWANELYRYYQDGWCN